MASAVVLYRSRLPVRIDDSKRLTRGQRQRAFRVIADHADVGFGIVCADRIDRDNILQATLGAMRLALFDLSTEPDLVLVDGPHSPRIDTPCWPLVRGDQRSHAIGCASIMAKVLRDSLMEFYHQLMPCYAFNRHKGYGTALHAVRLNAYGPCALHRRSFRPVLDVIEASAHGAEAHAR